MLPVVLVLLVWILVSYRVAVYYQVSLFSVLMTSGTGKLGYDTGQDNS